MSGDIKSILERLAALEGKITPVKLGHGLNKQQQGVPQLPALFKAKDISPTLAKKPYQQHPAAGYMVGEEQTALAETMRNVEEDMLGKVKRDFIDYLERLEDKALRQVHKQHHGDQELQAKAKQDIQTSAPETESAPVKTYFMEDGTALECWGNERDGFEIRRGKHRMPTKFRNLDHADIAVKLFQKKRAQQQQAQDYVDER